MKSISSSVRRSQTFLLALLASSAVFTAGCANMATTAGSGLSGDGVTLGGKIHGGNQPVGGATVNLWFADRGSHRLRYSPPPPPPRKLMAPVPFPSQRVLILAPETTHMFTSSPSAATPRVPAASTTPPLSFSLPTASAITFQPAVSST